MHKALFFFIMFATIKSTVESCDSMKIIRIILIILIPIFLGMMILLYNYKNEAKVIISERGEFTENIVLQ